MLPTTTALSLIETLDLSGARAWIGDSAPSECTFESCDLYRLPGFRPSASHFGRYESVWIVQNPMSLQGWRILLDSCVRMLQSSGTLVVRYVQNQHLSIPALKSFLFRKYGIRVSVRAELIENGEFTTAFQIERDNAVQPAGKSWTFGILTQGKKVDIVAQFCRSVRDHGGADHEIIIVGPRNVAYDVYHPVYIDKQYSQAFADICVKKNDIVARASHENLCVLHDRYILNQDFFSGFDAYGYDFDFLTIRQHHGSGKHYPSYCAMDEGGPLIWGPIYECGNENESWPRHYLNGGLVIAKRALLLAVPFNPLIFHNQAEDVELAKVMEDRSVVPRINRLSSAVTDVPDHLTDAFGYAEHPWELDSSTPALESAWVPAPALAPPASGTATVTVAAPMPMTEPVALPWRRLHGISRRVINLRRDGHGWAAVAGTATRFVLRRLAGSSRMVVPTVGTVPTVTAAPAAPIIAATAAAAQRQRPHDQEGCNILLYAGDAGGVLNLSVHYMRRLRHNGAPFCIVAIDQAADNSLLPDDLAPYVSRDPIYPRNIWCIGFPFMAQHLHVYSAWAAGRWNVNFTHWELPYIPRRLADNFVHLDGLMTTSLFVRDALVSVCSLPVELVDPDVRIAGTTVARFDRHYFGLPLDKKLFLLNWEFTSSTIRKNPAAAVRAFEEAFADIGEQVALVMHVKISSGKDAATHASYADFLKEIREKHPHVIVINRESFSYEEALGLKHACDCYVSLHRSEGYGMGCAEALALGRYCVMTGWSGNLELLKNPAWADRIALVAVALVPVGPDDFPWVDEADDVVQFWADPRPGDAAKKMRKVYQMMTLEQG